MTPIQTFIEEENKRFDTEFRTFRVGVCYFYDNGKDVRRASFDDEKVKSFISSHDKRLLDVIVEMMEKGKCKVPKRPEDMGKNYTEDIINNVLKYAGRYNYNKALADVQSQLINYQKEI